MSDTQYSKAKILVVDDTQANLRAMRVLLKKVDADIIEASSGNEALALALQHDFALILLDIQMPEMDGYEVAHFLRDEDITKHVPIIFVTALNQGNEQRIKAYRAGAIDFIEKPINEDVLFSKVNQFLELYGVNIRLKRQEENARLTLESIADPIIVVSDNNIVFKNNSAEELAKVYGIDAKTKQLDRFFSFEPHNLITLKEMVKSVEVSKKPLDTAYEFAFSPNELTEKRIYEVRVIPLESSRRSKVMLIFHDVSESRSLSDQLSYQAQHDSLTGLPNRRFFEVAFNAALSRAKRHNSAVGLFLIDLDHFKEVNDILGHFAGDKVLQEATNRIKNCLRDADVLVRFGGDEFCVLLEDISTKNDLLYPAKRINQALAKKFFIEDTDCTLGASIGITSTLDMQERDSSAMLSDADLAMYQAKFNGRGTSVVFTRVMREETQHRIALENEFERALKNEEFELYYQPQIKIKNGRLIGLEALIRWNHPKRGLVSPGEFIPILEKSAYMEQVGQWVIEEACRQLSVWKSQGYQLPCVSVNVSPKQFNTEDFPALVKKTLLKHGLKAQNLGIEITETLFMDLTKEIENNIRSLSNMGCKISLDDFGTGFSSLSYLIRFPIDVIKIDQIFIRSLLSNLQYQILVTAVIGISKGFDNMEVIAEGVEKVSQAATLAELGCDAYQGYLYSRPLPALQVEAMLYLKQSDEHRVKHDTTCES